MATRRKVVSSFKNGVLSWMNYWEVTLTCGHTETVNGYKGVAPKTAMCRKCNPLNFEVPK